MATKYKSNIKVSVPEKTVLLMITNCHKISNRKKARYWTVKLYTYVIEYKNNILNYIDNKISFFNNLVIRTSKFSIFLF